jgi:hypothetical protein
LEVSIKEEDVKSDKAKYVESHLFQFKLADPVDAAPDGTAGHTAHRPLTLGSSPHQLLQTHRHITLSGMTHSVIYLENCNKAIAHDPKPAPLT